MAKKFIEERFSPNSETSIFLNDFDGIDFGVRTRNAFSANRVIRGFYRDDIYTQKDIFTKYFNGITLARKQIKSDCTKKIYIEIDVEHVIPNIEEIVTTLSTIGVAGNISILNIPNVFTNPFSLLVDISFGFIFGEFDETFVSGDTDKQFLPHEQILGSNEIMKGLAVFDEYKLANNEGIPASLLSLSDIEKINLLKRYTLGVELNKANNQMSVTMYSNGQTFDLTGCVKQFTYNQTPVPATFFCQHGQMHSELMAYLFGNIVNYKALADVMLQYFKKSGVRLKFKSNETYRSPNQHSYFSLVDYNDVIPHNVKFVSPDFSLRSVLVFREKGVLMERVRFTQDSGTSSSDFITKIPVQKITGYLNYPLEEKLGEKLYISIDNGATFPHQVKNIDGTWFESEDITLTQSSGLMFRIVDKYNTFYDSTIVSYTLITTPPSYTIVTNSLSVDNGFANNDFKTNQLSQTINASLSSVLDPTDILWGSVDSGTTWTPITTYVQPGTTAIAWQTLLVDGTHSIQFKVEDIAGNVGAITGVKEYTVNRTTLLHKFETNTSKDLVLPLYSNFKAQFMKYDTASQGTGDYTNESGLTLHPSSDANTSTKVNVIRFMYGYESVRSPDTARPFIIPDQERIVLSLDNGVTWQNITNQWNSSNDETYLDTQSPLKVRYFEVGVELKDGVNTCLIKVIDLFGNESETWSQPYVLDQVNPVNKAVVTYITNAHHTAYPTDGSILIGEDAPFTIVANLDSILTPGDKLDLSIDNGTTWQNVTNRVTHTTVAVQNLTLLNSSAIKFRITDIAGNVGVVSSVNYNRRFRSNKNITGVSFIYDTFNLGDFITREKTNIIQGTLTVPLEPHETLWGNVGSGWVNVTNKLVSNATLLWDVNLLDGLNQFKFIIRNDVNEYGPEIGVTTYRCDTTFTQPIGVTITGIARSNGVDLPDFKTNQIDIIVKGQLSRPLFRNPSQKIYEVVEASRAGGTGLYWEVVPDADVQGTQVTWRIAIPTYDSLKLPQLSMRVRDIADNISAVDTKNITVVLSLSPIDVTFVSYKYIIANIVSDPKTDWAAIILKQIYPSVTFTRNLTASEKLQFSVRDGSPWIDAGNTGLNISSLNWSVHLTPFTLFEGDLNYIRFRVIDNVGNVRECPTAKPYACREWRIKDMDRLGDRLTYNGNYYVNWDGNTFTVPNATNIKAIIPEMIWTRFLLDNNGGLWGWGEGGYRRLIQNLGEANYHVHTENKIYLASNVDRAFVWEHGATNYRVFIQTQYNQMYAYGRGWPFVPAGPTVGAILGGTNTWPRGGSDYSPLGIGVNYEAIGFHQVVNYSGNLSEYAESMSCSDTGTAFLLKDSRNVVFSGMRWVGANGNLDDKFESSAFQIKSNSFSTIYSNISSFSLSPFTIRAGEGGESSQFASKSFFTSEMMSTKSVTSGPGYVGDLRSFRPPGIPRPQIAYIKGMSTICDLQEYDGLKALGTDDTNWPTVARFVDGSLYKLELILDGTILAQSWVTDFGSADRGLIENYTLMDTNVVWAEVVGHTCYYLHQAGPSDYILKAFMRDSPAVVWLWRGPANLLPFHSRDRLDWVNKCPFNMRAIHVNSEVTTGYYANNFLRDTDGCLHIRDELNRVRTYFRIGSSIYIANQAYSRDIIVDNNPSKGWREVIHGHFGLD